MAIDPKSPSSNSGSGADAGTITASQHIFVPFPRPEHERIPFLEIFAKDSREVITVVELLSPTNKYSGPDREAFLRKRLALLNRGANYVEIDLLRGGPRMPIRDLPRCDYYAYVNRFYTRPDVDFWPISLRDRLPRIPIPVLPEDQDARVDLQEILSSIYDRACYYLTIYQGKPEPNLSPEDAAWAQQFVPPQA